MSRPSRLDKICNYFQDREILPADRSVSAKEKNS